MGLSVLKIIHDINELWFDCPYLNSTKQPPRDRIFCEPSALSAPGTTTLTTSGSTASAALGTSALTTSGSTTLTTSGSTTLTTSLRF
ncbi:MAG: hypothetical protein JNM00_03850 [Flavobacteriales bacterium]|nr:hypothetical protein [Flavobacteriales bacterium]